MEYFAIGDEDTILGFNLVGVAGEVVTSGEEALAAFERTLKRPDIGIVIITERVAESIRETVDRYTFTAEFPLIVEVPDRKGKLPGRPTLRELANAAIGVSV